MSLPPANLRISPSSGGRHASTNRSASVWIQRQANGSRGLNNLDYLVEGCCDLTNRGFG